MSAEYVTVQWNRQKRWYDSALAAMVIAFLALFCAVSKWRFPDITDEILLLRALGTAAFLLLHAILCIGPLCRLDRRFLPLLYNRRHAGVALFILALAHAVIVMLTYHAGGDVSPIQSLLENRLPSGASDGWPFQLFGALALIFLLLMAATSHDFWLSQLTGPVWKTLHMSVYLAYALLVLHVSFGVLQAETSGLYRVAMGAGLAMVISLHLTAGLKETRADGKMKNEEQKDGYQNICALSDLVEDRGHIFRLGAERIALFNHGGKVFAVSNVCQHQNGPIGEGRVVNGCITCPWHGYQYLPETGASPPPFKERISTFQVLVQNGRVWVHPTPRKHE